VKQYGLDKAPADEIYVPMAQNRFWTPSGRQTTAEPMSIARSVIELLYALIRISRGCNARSNRCAPESVAAPRLTTSLLGLFALLAMAIAATGIGA